MRTSTIRSYEELPLFLNAKTIAEVLGICDIAQMLADEVPYPEQSQYDGVDSRLRREIEAKKRGELGMSM